MRTEEWLRTRMQRARGRILADAQCASLDVGTLEAALKEITDDPPNASDVKVLAEALGALRVDAFLHLLQQTRESLIREALDGAVDAIRALTQSSSEQAVQTIMDVQRREASAGASYPLRQALALQALLWAVSPPNSEDSPICY